jgi:hypothetical protein
MVAHRARDADSSRWALGFKPGRHVHALSMQICAIGDHIADVYANAKPDGSIERLIAVIFGHMLLDADRATHSSIDAIELDEQ